LRLSGIKASQATAAAPFALLAACLGLDIDHENGAITFKQPMLPEMTHDTF
jgi:hypothetical protein